MSTVICETPNLAFLHIPKCGGHAFSTSLLQVVEADIRFTSQYRNLLKSTLTDAESDTYSSYLEHSEFGKLNGSHVSLQYMKRYYPEVLSRLKETDNYAVCREPHSRFISGVGQIVKEFDGKVMSLMSASELEMVVSDCIENMKATPECPSLRYMHLLRQTDFIYLDGERITQNLYPLAQMSQMSSDICRRHNLRIPEVRHENKNSYYRYTKLLKSIAFLGRKVKNTFPSELYGRINYNIKQKFLTSPQTTSAGIPPIFRSDWVKSFVKDFYNEDREHYLEASLRFKTTDAFSY